MQDNVDDNEDDGSTLHDAGIHLARPVVLVGMMGAGKSTVGAHVARFLGVPFYDNDREIERRAGMTVAELFAAEGEAGFREFEAQSVEELLGKPPHVLALGGGAFTNERVRALCLAQAQSIWLEAPFEVLYQRAASHERPLFGTCADFRGLLAERTPFYKMAPFTVDARSEPQALAKQIVHLVHTA